MRGGGSPQPAGPSFLASEADDRVLLLLGRWEIDGRKHGGWDKAVQRQRTETERAATAGLQSIDRALKQWRAGKMFLSKRWGKKRDGKAAVELGRRGRLGLRRSKMEGHRGTADESSSSPPVAPVARCKSPVRIVRRSRAVRESVSHGDAWCKGARTTAWMEGWARRTRQTADDRRLDGDWTDGRRRPGFCCQRPD